MSFAIGDVPSWGALGASMALVMFAYSGMETALVPSGELRDPSRNVPRATVVAILLVVLLYLGLQIVGQGVLGASLADEQVPVADTAGALWSPGRVLLLITACISMTGFMMGNLLGTSRLVFALGRDGYLPRAFGRVSAKHRVPMLALIAHATPAWVLAIGGSFDTLALISGGAICLVYGLVSLAAWRAQALDLRERGERRSCCRAAPLIPVGRRRRDGRDRLHAQARRVDGDRHRAGGAGRRVRGAAAAAHDAGTTIAGHAADDQHSSQPGTWLSHVRRRTRAAAIGSRQVEVS